MLYFFLHVHAGYIRATTTALAVPMSGKKRTKKGKTVTALSQLKILSTWPDSSKRKIKLLYSAQVKEGKTKKRGVTDDDKELLEKIFEWNEFDVQSEDLLSLNGDVSVYGWQHVVNFALYEKYNFLLPLLKEYLTSSARKGGLEDSFDSLRDDQHGLKDFVYVYCTMLTLILRKQEPEEQAIGLVMDALEEVFGPSLEGRLETDEDLMRAFDNYITVVTTPPVTPPRRQSARLAAQRQPSGPSSETLYFKQAEGEGGTSMVFGASKPLRATVVRNDGTGLCGYLAFGQWLQKYRPRLLPADTQCDALRRSVAEFNLSQNDCGITNDEFLAAQARARAANAGARENWMTDVELGILGCIFNVCVVVYKDYRSTGTMTYKSGPQVNTELNAVTYTMVNPAICNEPEIRQSDKTVWLWNNETTLRGIQHYELLIDVEFKKK